MRAREFVDEMAYPSSWDAHAMTMNPSKKYKDPSPESISDYARKMAKEIGIGSSRIVLKVPMNGEQTAFKVALNQYGIQQNKKEINNLSNPKIQNTGIVIPLRDYDKTNENEPAWIQVALAKTVDNESELTAALGTKESLDKFVTAADSLADKIEQENSDPKVLAKQVGKTKGVKYAKNVVKLAKLLSIFRSWDIDNFKNWGIYDDRPVIVDLGV